MPGKGIGMGGVLRWGECGRDMGKSGGVGKDQIGSRCASGLGLIRFVFFDFLGAGYWRKSLV